MNASRQGCACARACLCAWITFISPQLIGPLPLTLCAHDSFPSFTSLFKIPPSFAARPSRALSFFHTSHKLDNAFYPFFSFFKDLSVL